MRGLILLSFAVACGGEPDTNADDAATGVDARRDAGVTETRINGVVSDAAVKIFVQQILR